MNIRQVVLIIFIGLFVFFTTLSIPNIVEAGLVPCGPGICLAECHQDKCENYRKYQRNPRDYAHYSGLGIHCPIDCQICHLFVLVWRIVNFILYTIVPPLAALFLVFAGFKYYQAAVENPDEAQKVKSVIISVGIGLVIVYGSLGFLTVFTEHIGRIPIYSHIKDIIAACPKVGDPKQRFEPPQIEPPRIEPPRNYHARLSSNQFQGNHNCDDFPQNCCPVNYTMCALAQLEEYIRAGTVHGRGRGWVNEGGRGWCWRPPYGRWANNARGAGGSVRSVPGYSVEENRCNIFNYVWCCPIRH